MNELQQPIGAYATIKWLDDGVIGHNCFFNFDEGADDDYSFFYCSGENDVKEAMTEGMEDFVVLDYELVYSHADEL